MVYKVLCNPGLQKSTTSPPSVKSFGHYLLAHCCLLNTSGVLSPSTLHFAFALALPPLQASVRYPHPSLPHPTGDLGNKYHFSEVSLTILFKITSLQGLLLEFPTSAVTHLLSLGSSILILSSLSAELLFSVN